MWADEDAGGIDVKCGPHRNQYSLEIPLDILSAIRSLNSIGDLFHVH